MDEGVPAREATSTREEGLLEEDAKEADADGDEPGVDEAAAA